MAMAKTTTSSTAGGRGQEADDGYPALRAYLAGRLAGSLSGGPVFRTDAAREALWESFHSSLPPDRGRHYNCHACRGFIQRYGGLVTICPHGETKSVLWAGNLFSASEVFGGAVVTLNATVRRAKVTGVFLTGKTELGHAATISAGGAEWQHFYAPVAKPFAHSLRTAGQEMARIAEDYRVLQRSLADFNRGHAEQAVRLLESGQLSRAEKALEAARWFLQLHQAREAAHDGKRQHHVVWLATATAPEGFAHVRGNVLGTLLEDIAAGMAFEVIAARWALRLKADNYQRPKAAPTEGAIGQAEKLVDKLELGPSLQRRYATLEDVLAICTPEWLPHVTLTEDGPKGGHFSHLRKGRLEAVPQVDLPPMTMTYERFRNEVLTTALTVEAELPRVGAYYGLLTAVDPAAKPILQWDGLASQNPLDLGAPLPRNPVSWYFYVNGSQPARWGLTGQWAKVTAVFRGPHEWQQPQLFRHQGQKVFFALHGARDSKPSSLCLFPEILRGELREVRKVIEAHSNSGTPAGAEAGNVNGLGFHEDSGPVRLRVGSAGGTRLITIDRMY